MSWFLNPFSFCNILNWRKEYLNRHFRTLHLGIYGSDKGIEKHLTNDQLLTFLLFFNISRNTGNGIYTRISSCNYSELHRTRLPRRTTGILWLFKISETKSTAWGLDLGRMRWRPRIRIQVSLDFLFPMLLQNLRWMRYFNPF